MFRLLSLLICAAMFAGCAQNRGNWQSAQNAQASLNSGLERVKAQCRERRESGFYKTFVEQAECQTKGENVLYQAHSTRHMDLVNIMQTYRAALAPRIDSGEISMEEANVQLAELYSRLQIEAGQRDLIMQQQQLTAAQVRSQRLHAYGAFLSGIGNWVSAYRPPQRRTVTCFQSLNTITCH